jgi:hypothetical protein
MYKTCSRCKEQKLFSEFSKHKSKKDGHCGQCKICVKEYQQTNRKQIAVREKEYKQANKAKIADQMQKWTLANKDSIKERMSEYRIVNKSKIAAQRKSYNEDNKDKIIEYQQANKEKINARSALWQRVNKDKVNAKTAKRRAVRLQATPLWLTTEDFAQIQELYTCAQMFKLYTGEEYHVDHIVPLQGKNVCGLHVPWNLQVIPAKENRSKSNKLQEELL